MILAEAIYKQSLSLPEIAAREALDFIEFLKQRYEKPTTFISENEQKRQNALAHIAAMKVHFGGKPIPNRDALYDEVRG